MHLMIVRGEKNYGVISLKTHDAWVICENLNCMLNPDERIRTIVREGEIRAIGECIHDMSLLI